MSNGKSLTLNQKVLIWAQGKLGQQVGDGECWTLAESAVTNSGGQSSKGLTGGDADDFSDADYVWGDAVKLDDAKPGDVLQFRDYSFEATTTQTNGAWNSRTGERGHHTAIVARNLGNGQLVVIEQNVDPGGKRVQQNTIYVKDGVTIAGAKGATTSISTSGSVTAYRPKPK
jgi:hypothetical protein